MAELHSISTTTTTSRSYPWRGEGRGRRQCTASMRLALGAPHILRGVTLGTATMPGWSEGSRRPYYQAGCPDADGESKTSRANVNWDISQNYVRYLSNGRSFDLSWEGRVGVRRSEGGVAAAGQSVRTPDGDSGLPSQLCFPSNASFPLIYPPGSGRREGMR